MKTRLGQTRTPASEPAPVAISLRPASAPSLAEVWWCWACLALFSALTAQAQTAVEIYRFFAEEAQVITASRIPQAANRVPATVYVVSGEELRTSGAQTLWDALRSVPGMDVMTVRTFQGSVSIRGLNKALNNRTLVLVDGRNSMAMSVVDYSFWENLPVLLEEVERIEIVEGPASALYGANATNGLINIITKKPAQAGGGLVSYSIGERQVQTASLLYGRQQGRLGYKFGLGGRTGNSFADPNHRASQTLKGTGYLSYDLGQHTQLSLSGGRTGLDTEAAGAKFNRVNIDGTVGFLRLDGIHRNTRLRCYHNTADIMVDFSLYNRRTNEQNEVWDLNLEQLIPLSTRSTAVVGAGYRNATLESGYGSTHGTLWSAFAEHQWRPTPRWALWTGARLDAELHTQPAFSPRFSLIFTPTPGQALRLSAAAAYRNPTFGDNRLSFSDTLQVGNLVVAVVNTGNPDLKPERIKSFELAYQLERGRYKALVTGFGYRLEQLILASTAASGTDLNHLTLQLSYLNRGALDAWGSEVGMEFPLHRHTTGFANYSYQDLRGTMDPQATGHGTPHHKVNGGLRFAAGRFNAKTAAHWVSRTLWLNNNPLTPRYQQVPGYALVDLHLGYRLAGRWQGFELAFAASNLFDHQHYETLPSKGILAIGQSAEIIRARRTANILYRF